MFTRKKTMSMPQLSHLSIASEILHYAHDHALSQEERIERSIELAVHLLYEANANLRADEKSRMKMLSSMMNDPSGKAFFMALTDQCFRAKDAARTANQLIHLLEIFGVPSFLSPFKRWAFSLFQSFGQKIPNLFVPIMTSVLRKETSHLLIPAEKPLIDKHLGERIKEGFSLNVNHLGEAVLSEVDAQKRINAYLQNLQNPLIDAISVKISSIFSQIHLISYEDSLEKISDRFRTLLRKADECGSKMVNLDMESTDDVDLTIDTFQKVLDEEEFHSHHAGLVLQSYLPQSFPLLQKLTAWAKERIEKGRAPIRIRLVKGANMNLERVHSSISNLPSPILHEKSETDANFKKMLLFATEPENAKAVHIGIGSHNIFDIALAFVLRAEKNVEEHISFEMLDGMANHMARTVQKLSENVRLYCPIVHRDEYADAIAYLVRRFEENSGTENFLRHIFTISPGSSGWESSVRIFRESFADIDGLPENPFREQNRSEMPKLAEKGFDNEPNTDLSLSQERAWADSIYKTWEHKTISEPISLMIGGKEVLHKPLQQGKDPSMPEKNLYQYSLATPEDVEVMLKTASSHLEPWANTPFEEKAAMALQAATNIARRRGDLIGAMMADGGKAFTEADGEVSEAIDFVLFYRDMMGKIHERKELQLTPKGTVLIAPPWNFPVAIPTTGIITTLISGNCAIFKPSKETVLCGQMLAKCFWDAGFPKEVLQFVCMDSEMGSKCIKDPRVNRVVLTGSWDTAKVFLQMKPGLDLAAETGGKNAMIISSMSDRDHAISLLIQSAFGHSGQKCSATSLAILEKELYDDKNFREKLKEAAASLSVGSVWEKFSKITPLVRLATDPLLQGLTTLQPGESWLLEPKQDPNNPNLWSPGIKLGVKKGSFTHQTEFFGPLLALMRADNISHAIGLANGTKYGLTSGLQSLDDREQKQWIQEIVAGNLYINRTTTGAIVRRQPFGGCKNSSYGTGLKIGGPNTLYEYFHIHQKQLPKEHHAVSEIVNGLSSVMSKFDLTTEEMGLWHASLANYAFWWQRFKQGIDITKLIGQDNLLFYAPIKKLCIRVKKTDRPIDYMRSLAAALTCSTPIQLSWDLAPNFPPKADWEPILPFFNISQDTDDQLFEKIRLGRIKRLRTFSTPENSLSICCSETCCYNDYQETLASGRIELLRYLRPVSLSHDYHRYGNLGLRESEIRKHL